MPTFLTLKTFLRNLVPRISIFFKLCLVRLLKLLTQFFPKWFCNLISGRHAGYSPLHSLNAATFLKTILAWNTDEDESVASYSHVHVQAGAQAVQLYAGTYFFISKILTPDMRL